MNSKRQCNAACGTKTVQAATVGPDGRPAWECTCCGHQTPRRTRAPKRTELDKLFDSLTA